jgi:hypothetical protein
LLMSTCGLVFVGSAAPIAVPFILVGAGMIWGGVALYRSWRESKAATTPPVPPDNSPPPG